MQRCCWSTRVYCVQRSLLLLVLLTLVLYVVLDIWGTESKIDERLVELTETDAIESSSHLLLIGAEEDLKSAKIFNDTFKNIVQIFQSRVSSSARVEQIKSTISAKVHKNSNGDNFVSDHNYQNNTNSINGTNTKTKKSNNSTHSKKKSVDVISNKIEKDKGKHAIKNFDQHHDSGKKNTRGSEKITDHIAPIAGVEGNGKQLKDYMIEFSAPNPKIVQFKEISRTSIDAGDCVADLNVAKNGISSQNSPFCLPLLICIGSAKSGTGELQRWLAHHPSLIAGHCKGVGPCPPADGVGEIQFFNNLDSVCPHCMVNSSTDSTGINRTRLTLHYLMSSSSHLIVNDRQKQNTRMDSYFFFNHIPTESVGNVWNFEKSPHYLDSADPSHIRAVMPSVRLIVLLRHPTRRLYSCWQHCFAQHLHSLDNTQAISKTVADICGGTNFSHVLHNIFDTKGPLVETRRRHDVHKKYRKTLRCVEQGRYAEHLERYFAVFPHNQLLIILHDDFIHNPFSVLKQIEQHAGLPTYNFRDIATLKQDDAGRSYWTMQGQHSKEVKTSRFGLHPMTIHDFNTIQSYYKKYIKQLQTLLPEKDLLSWQQMTFFQLQ